MGMHRRGDDASVGPAKKVCQKLAPNYNVDGAPLSGASGPSHIIGGENWTENSSKQNNPPGKGDITDIPVFSGLPNAMRNSPRQKNSHINPNSDIFENSLENHPLKNPAPNENPPQNIADEISRKSENYLPPKPFSGDPLIPIIDCEIASQISPPPESPLITGSPPKSPLPESPTDPPQVPHLQIGGNIYSDWLFEGSISPEGIFRTQKGVHQKIEGNPIHGEMNEGEKNQGEKNQGEKNEEFFPPNKRILPTAQILTYPAREINLYDEKPLEDVIFKKIDFAKSKRILAPMVKISVLPFRIDCLEYGADLVYSEETIAKRLAICKRVTDKGIVRYVVPSRLDAGSAGGGLIAFSTIPSLEKDKVLLQLGTADSQIALKAALNVVHDVAAIDINMGCPKGFSVKDGAGAALLKTPEIASDILKTLSRNLPCQVTAKIRLSSHGNRQNIPQTIDFIKMLEQSGASAVAIHAREEHERPSQAAHWGVLPQIVSADINIPLIACGDFIKKEDISSFQNRTGLYEMPIMLARGAMWNPSIFSSEPILVPSQIAGRLTKKCVIMGESYQSIKFINQTLFVKSGTREEKEIITRAKSTGRICEILGLRDWYSNLRLPQLWNTLPHYKNLALEL